MPPDPGVVMVSTPGVVMVSTPGVVMVCEHPSLPLEPQRLKRVRHVNAMLLGYGANQCHPHSYPDIITMVVNANLLKFPPRSDPSVRVTTE